MSIAYVRVIAFVVGAASLGAEISAARLLAPYFGASTIIWANTIATVLVALSVGYWLGGRIADRRSDLRGLCAIVIVARTALVAADLEVVVDFFFFVLGLVFGLGAGTAFGTLAQGVENFAADFGLYYRP